MKKYGAPSVKKAFAILSVISSSREGLGVSELAKSLKMAKSTVHGMTSALEELGAVMRDPLTKKYKLGFTLLEIGRSAYSQIDLRSAARVMQHLGMNYKIGDKISKEDVGRIASKFSEILFEAITGPANSAIARQLMLTDDLQFPSHIDEYSFSGGGRRVDVWRAEPL